jgi:flagellar biosynthesis chaperone FliJ
LLQIGTQALRIRQLESQIEQGEQHAAGLQSMSAELAAAQQQLRHLQDTAKAAEDQAAASEKAAQQAHASLDHKMAELQALELAMGELTYEAESARGAELRSRQLQV